MGRRRKPRQIEVPPLYNIFKPAGVSVNQLEEIVLTLGEYEAIRLCDYEKLNHEEASKLMKVSRPTFTRIIESAHEKIGIGFVEGRAIRIEGGNYSIMSNVFLCRECGYRWQGIEHPDICPNCGSENIICLGVQYGMCRRHRCRHGRR